MRGSRKFFSEEVHILITFFLVDIGIEDTNTSKSGPSSARQLWRADDGPSLNAGFVFCDFSGDPDQYC